MSVSKAAKEFLKNKENKQIRISKYQKYETDIIFLRKNGMTFQNIADFLEKEYGIAKTKGVTALRSFIKNREKNNKEVT